jgi:hypothetical protein
MPKEKKDKSKGTEFERSIIRFVSDVFDSKDLNYSSNVVVGNTSSDFFVVSPTGSTAVFEVKNWSPSPANIRRASHMSSLYLSASGADNAFIILPGRRTISPSTGVISTSQVDNIVDTNIIHAPAKTRKSTPEAKPIPKDHIFAAMPFAAIYDDTFLVAMKPAALELGYECIRVDHEHFSGDVVKEIKGLIKQSVLVVADLSDSRPNVLFELGYAEASDIPFVQISTDRNSLPFDVRNNKTLGYSIGQTTRLKSRLVKEFQALL